MRHSTPLPRLRFSSSRQRPQAMPRRLDVERDASDAFQASRDASRISLEGCASLPGLVVFDLDYCFWPCYCEMYQPHHKAKVFQSALGVLEALVERNVKVAVASRTPTPDVARSFLRQLQVESKFCNLQIIPALDGCDHVTAQKDLEHFPNLRLETGVAYEDMLFFDDEEQNVVRVSRLGVSSVLVDQRQGIHHEVLHAGLAQYVQQKDGRRRST